jgi:integrase
VSAEWHFQEYAEEKSLPPVLPEVLEVLRELLESLPDLADDQPIFRGAKGAGRHQGKPLEAQDVHNVIRRILDEAGGRPEIPDVIPYDLRDSFAAYVGRRC